LTNGLRVKIDKGNRFGYLICHSVALL